MSIECFCPNIPGWECGLPLLALEGEAEQVFSWEDIPSAERSSPPSREGESTLQEETSAFDLIEYATRILQGDPNSPPFQKAVSCILVLGRNRGEQLLASQEFGSARSLLLRLMELFQTHKVDCKRYLHWTSTLLAEANKQLGNREEALQHMKVALRVWSSSNHHSVQQKRNLLRCYSELAPNEGIDEFVRGVQEIDAVVHTLVATEMLAQGQSQLALRKIERMRGLDLSDKELVKQRLVTHNLSAELVESLWSERRDGVEGGKKRKWTTLSSPVPIDEVLCQLLAHVNEGSGVHTQLQSLLLDKGKSQHCIVQGIKQLMDGQKFEVAREVTSALLGRTQRAFSLLPSLRIELDCCLVRCKLHANDTTEVDARCMDAIMQVTMRGRYNPELKRRVVTTYFEMLQKLGREDALVQRMGSIESQVHTLAAAQHLKVGKLACAMRKIRMLRPPAADLPLIHERLAPLLEERGISMQQFLAQVHPVE